MPKRANRQSLVVYAKNKRRVSAFYQRTLDLDVVEERSTHDVLRGRGIELVVHAIPRRFAAQIALTRPPLIREDTPLKPIFAVKSLEAVRIAAEAAGGALRPMEAAWHDDGATVLDGHDPEGNVVQFREYGVRPRAQPNPRG